MLRSIKIKEKQLSRNYSSVGYKSTSNVQKVREDQAYRSNLPINRTFQNSYENEDLEIKAPDPVKASLKAQIARPYTASKASLLNVSKTSADSSLERANSSYRNSKSKLGTFRKLHSSNTHQPPISSLVE